MQCGGADPEGEMLVKWRKVATCIECGQRLRGLDHSKCEAAMADQSAGFRTPVAELVSKHEHGKISREKKFDGQGEASHPEAPPATKGRRSDHLRNGVGDTCEAYVKRSISFLDFLVMFGEEEGSEPNFVRLTIDAHGMLVLMERSIAPENDKFTL